MELLIAVVIAFLVGISIPLGTMAVGAAYIKRHPEIFIKFMTHKMMQSVKQAKREAVKPNGNADLSDI